jgi:hypothetical protein
MLSLVRKTTVRFFIGAVVGFAAAGMMIRIPRPISLSQSNASTVKARRTEIAFERVVSLAPTACCASDPIVQLEMKTGCELNNDRAWTVCQRGFMNVNSSSTDRSSTEQLRLVLRC